ncbi:MAG: hypothetical protein QXN89_03915 [Candidatus Woesearchaeota archaeon]
MVIDLENRPLYCSECKILVLREHFEYHGMFPTLIVKLHYGRGLVEFYCMYCRKLVHTDYTFSFDFPGMVRKLSKHFLTCMAEPAEGWSDEARRLINDFLLRHLFKPRDRLRVSVNLLQAERNRDSGLQR